MKRIGIFLLTLVITFTSTIVLVSAVNVPFQDIWDLDEYTQDNIEYLYKEGIMNGTSATTFSPHDYYTRSMFVTMMGRMMEVNPSDYAYSPFEDVPAGRWDAPYVAWAAETGLVNGIGDNKFNPTGIITLEQYCAIICRFWNWAGFVVNYDSSFENWPLKIENLEEISSYAIENVSDMVEIGMVSFSTLYDENSGRTKSVYVEPKQQLTREWIAFWFGDLHYILNYDDSIIHEELNPDGSETGNTIETWVEW